jgi:hydrogenase-4 component B
MIGAESWFIVAMFIGWVGNALQIVCPTKTLSKLTFAITVLMAVLSGWPALTALTGNSIGFYLGLGTFLGQVPFLIDGLSAWFIVLVNIGMVLAAYNARFYVQPSQRLGRFHNVSLVVLHQSLLWVTTVQHGLVFLCLWEIMSLSSVMLMLQNLSNIKQSRSVMHYLIQMHVGGALLTVGFVWLYVRTGSFLFNGIAQLFLVEQPLWPFLLFFIGFGLKAEFVPLHGKVPHVYRFVPPHVAAILSGVMVKMGVFGIFRLVTYLQSDWLLLGEIVLTVSAITAIYGVLNTAVHRNLQRMLAYCTIENVGIVGVGIGLGMVGVGTQMPSLVYLGFGGALLHTLNHLLGKSLVFYSGGWSIGQMGTSHIDQMGGLAKHQPQTAFLFLVGALALVGMPPLNGFVSEFMLVLGLVNGLSVSGIALSSLMALSLGALALVGGVALLTFTKTFGVVYLGHQRTQTVEKPKEAPFSYLFPQYVVAAAMLFIALFPSVFVTLVQGVVGGIGLPMPQANASYTQPFVEVVYGLNLKIMVLLGFVGLVWATRRLALRNASVRVDQTWSCGYASPSTKLQYTGKSFSKPLGKIFSFILIEHKCHAEHWQRDAFMKSRKYSTHYRDLIETKVLDELLKRIFHWVNYLKFIQNGRTQSYVMYGIVFILAVFVLTLFNLVP